MKLLFVVFTLFSTLAFAQTKPDVNKEFGLRSVTVGLEKGYTKTVSGTDVDKMGESTTLSVSAIYNNNMTFDWRAMTSQQNSYSGKFGSPTSYQEIGPGYRYSLGKDLPTASIKVYLQQYEKPTKRYLGYAVDLGLGGRILDSKFSYQISYKNFDSFENSAANTAKHWQRRLILSYNINKNHSVYVKKQDQRGYTEYDGLYVGYRHTF